MTEALIIRVPAELGELLIDEGDAVPLLMTRSGGVGQIIELTLNGGSIAADALTLTMSLPVLRRLGRTLRRSPPKGSSGMIGLSVSGPNGSFVINIPIGATEDEAERIFRSALVAAGLDKND